MRANPVGLDLRPRASWARGLGEVPVMPHENDGDVRILLVHHTASTNRYEPAEVAGILASFHRYHTGPEKRWPDIAYNFLVDRFGVVWEGRSGSIDSPVIPDATGGNQGFSQLVCLVGDHTVEEPTPEARRSVAIMLAWLADRYGVATEPGSRARFVSRGSNLLPAGTAVDLPTIAAHRQVSQTTCPGDAAFAWVRDLLPPEVHALRSGPSSVDDLDTTEFDKSPTTGSTDPSEVVPPSNPQDESLVADDTALASASTSPTRRATVPPGVERSADPRAAGSESTGEGPSPLPWVVSGATGAVVALAAGAIAIRRRRM